MSNSTSTNFRTVFWIKEAMMNQNTFYYFPFRVLLGQVEELGSGYSNSAWNSKVRMKLGHKQREDS